MKAIRIDYTAEIPDENFDKFCKQAGIGKRFAIDLIKKNAIEAAEREINYIVNETIIE
tara:strand:- start:94 stop:267 length:174 start_codon:yes stop_codon:yes gene_type:complete